MDGNASNGCVVDSFRQQLPFNTHLAAPSSNESNTLSQGAWTLNFMLCSMELTGKIGLHDDNNGRILID